MDSGELRQYILRPEISREIEKATLITITTGGNDLIRAFRRNAHFFDYLNTIRLMAMNIKKTLSYIKKRNAKATLFALGLYNPGPEEHEMYEMANRLIKRANRLGKKTVESFGYDWIDPMATFLNRPFLLADEVHPNDEGHRALANLLVEKHRWRTKAVKHFT